MGKRFHDVSQKVASKAEQLPRDGENEKNVVPKVFGAELFISTLILGLGVDQMLSKFDFEHIFSQIPSFVLIVALLLIVVYEAQMFMAWEHIYKHLSPDDLSVGGLVHFWGSILYSLLTYLICKDFDNYFLVLTFLSILVLLDLAMSYFDFRATTRSIGLRKNQIIEILVSTNRKWLKRDYKMWMPLMILAWGFHYFIDGDILSRNISLTTSILFFFSIIFIYSYDLINNRTFYGTESFAEHLGAYFGYIKKMSPVFFLQKTKRKKKIFIQK
jgi:hypothetical protein